LGIPLTKICAQTSRHFHSVFRCSKLLYVTSIVFFSISGLNQRFSTQITPRPVFLRKKFPQPATEDFHHLQTFLKTSFILLSTKKLYNCHAHDPFEILHNPFPGCDPSVEKRWFKPVVLNVESPAAHQRLRQTFLRPTIQLLNIFLPLLNV
jgi:hypothetical protein